MRIDEKIALLERENRNQNKMQREEAESKFQEELNEIKYTIEGLRKGIRRGKVILGFKIIKFINKKFLEDKLEIPFMTDFFDIEEDSSHSLWLASSVHSVTITAAKIDLPQKRNSLTEWKDEFYKEMLGNKIYTDIQKMQRMDVLDYLCYETPTAKGTLYHVTFRIFQKERYIIGTFNCESRYREKMGLLLEALVQEMNDLQKE